MGEILIYDLASSSLIDTIKAHTASVWSLHVKPDEKALVSGSADKDVKFWEFESKEGGIENVSIVYCKDEDTIIYISLAGSKRKFSNAHSYTHPQNDR